MIPNNLIFCNFGNMKLRPEIEQKCIESWEKFFPKSQWNWVELNEYTYDIHQHSYTHSAEGYKQYHLISDYARVDFLSHYGGIYVDLDLCMLKSLDNSFLQLPAFISRTSFYNIDPITGLMVSWGLVGAEPNNPIMKQMLKSFPALASKRGNPIEKTITTNVIQKALNFLYRPPNQISHLQDISIFPYDYFCCKRNKLDTPRITDNSYSVHLWGNSWIK